MALGETRKEKKRIDVLLPDPRIPKHSCSIFFLAGKSSPISPARH